MYKRVSRCKLLLVRATLLLQDKVSLQDEDVLDETLVPELHDLTDWMIEIPSITILPDSHGRPTYSFQVKVYKNNPYTGMIGM